MRSILLITALCLTTVLSAQDRNSEDMQQLIEERRKEYIIDQLQLTEEEQKNFWPIHEAFTEEREKTRKEKRNTDLSLLSDQEAKELLDNMVEREQKHLQLKSEYIDKMVEVLNPRKVLKYFHLENEFKKKLLRNYKHRVSDKQERSGERSKGFRK